MPETGGSPIRLQLRGGDSLVKRARLQDDDEDTSRGFLSLKNFLATRDPYRKMYPITGPLPIISTWIMHGNPFELKYDKICEIVKETLNKVDIKPSAIYLRLIGQHKAATCIVDIESESTRSWERLAHVLFQEFQTNDLSGLNVEIRHPQKTFCQSIFPIPVGDDGNNIVEAWDRVGQNVMEIVRKRLNKSSVTWNTVGVFMCGIDESTANPSILITAGLDDVANWSAVEDEIFRTLEVHEVEGLDVAFYKGEMVPSTLVTYEAGQKASPGDSIGIQGHKGSGTLGGFIELHLPAGTEPRVRYCLMTCHHVVNANDPAAAAFKNPLPLQPMSSTNPLATNMVSPSFSDLNDALNDKNAAHEYFAAKRTTLLKKKTDQDGFLQASETKTLEDLDLTLKSFQTTIDDLHQRASIFGRTIASSGWNKSRTGSKVDWALVEVRRQDFLSNHIPLLEIFKKLDPTERPPQTFVDSTGITQLAKPTTLQEGSWVMLRGRMSGVRPGLVNAIKLHCKWKTGNMESEEIVVAGIRDAQAFSADGDSGSWIFTANLELAGMQIAHMKAQDTPPRKLDLTVLSPMEDIWFDIEQSTGGKLCLPV